MKRALARCVQELGAMAVAALATVIAAAAVLLLAVHPLERQLVRLEGEVRRAARADEQGPKLAGEQRAAAKLAAFYGFFERGERSDAWLARLYGIASAAGLELRLGEYRLLEPSGRVERYQVTLPVSGTYAQIRAFLESSLAEVPIMSLDQVKFRRKSIGEPRVEADIVLTLHLGPS